MLKKRQFDRVEVLAIAALTAVVTANACQTPPRVINPLAGRAVTDELAPYLERFGPPLYSSHEEELFIRDWFGDRRGGMFLNVGAGHYQERSNTYYLEHHLGWSGIAIDALERFADDYATHRQKTRFFALFVSDVSDDRAKLFVGSNDLFSSADRRFTESWVEVADEHEIPTITLNDLLEREDVERLDFLSMGIELSRPKALAGFDVRQYQPELVCIEAHPQVRQALLDSFIGTGT